MLPEIRRIIAVEAHRRRTGCCPTVIHSLGTGESFEIKPNEGGFVDLSSGIESKTDGSSLLLSKGLGPIQLDLAGDIAFAGRDHVSSETFSGRAGGGATVTLYDDRQSLFFQYAVSTIEEWKSGQNAGSSSQLP
jgi:hypothetical protein